jgi:hypothetical protein
MSEDEMGMSPPSSPPADDNGLDEPLTLPKGVQKVVVTDGSGWEKPKELYEIKVNISAKHDDKVFDTNESDGSPRTYIVGSGLPCPGLDAAFKGMKKGEKATFTVQAAQAFGSAGIPDKNVPADASITYEVEVLDWTKVDDLSKAKDKSILVKTLFEGSEWDKPKESDFSFLRYRGRVQVTSKDWRDVASILSFFESISGWTCLTSFLVFRAERLFSFRKGCLRAPRLLDSRHQQSSLRVCSLPSRI